MRNCHSERIYRTSDGTDSELGGSNTGSLLGHPAHLARAEYWGSFSIEGSPFYCRAWFLYRAPSTDGRRDTLIAGSRHVWSSRPLSQLLKLQETARDLL